jgi:hypothetical protein
MEVVASGDYWNGKSKNQALLAIIIIKKTTINRVKS